MWTKELPKTPGLYWFYGKRFKQDKDDKLYFVRTSEIKNGFILVCEGVFMWESERGNGWFMAIDVPELPN